MDLPPNWRAAKDSDGKEYYFNELTGETSWTVPPQESETRVVPESVPAKVDMSAAADDGEFAPSSEPANDMIAVAMPSYGAPQDGNGGGQPPYRPGSLSAKYEEAAEAMGEGALPRLLIVTICSMVVFIQSAIKLSIVDQRPEGTKKFGIAVGVISFAFCLFVLTLSQAKREVFRDWRVPKVPGNLTIMQAFTMFLVPWWFTATVVLTFFSPFRETSNAYFATWIALACSLLMLGASVDRVGNAFRSMSASPIHADSNAKSLIGLIVSSAVVLCASIEFIPHPSGGSEAIFALVVGIFSTIFTAILFYLADRKRIGMGTQKAAAILLLCLWIAEVCTTTFFEPFESTGNGFFASWVALVCCIVFAFKCFYGGEGVEVFRRTISRSLSFHPMVDVRGESNLPMSTSEEGQVNGQVMPSMAPITPTANVV